MFDCGARGCRIIGVHCSAGAGSSKAHRREKIMKRSGRFLARHLWLVALGALVAGALIFSGPALAGSRAP